jgi:hypothetical protein
MGIVFINLHVRILKPPAIPVSDMVARAKAIYAPHDIIIRDTPSQPISSPELESLEVGIGPDDLTAEQKALFEKRDGMADTDICVYFVSEIKAVTNGVVLPVMGCSSHPPGKPAAVVAGHAPKWTLAHELGHVLGLIHEDGDPQRLMYETGDISFPNPTPYLVWKELDLIHNHCPLAQSE